MNLTPIGKNQTQLSLCNGDKVFFSYKTPVAARVGGLLFKTSEDWSPTTSKHVNKWIAGSRCEIRPQSFFDALCASV